MSEHAEKEYSRPLLWEYPPRDTETQGALFTIGKAREHMNRRGSTIHQLSELAQVDVSELVARRNSHLFILEDLGRGKDDQVITGAVATEHIQENGVDIRLDVLYVRDDYRGQGLGNYTVGKLISGIVADNVPATRLIIPTRSDVSGQWQETLTQKGFRHNGDSLSLLLPGLVRPSYMQSPPLDELEASIRQQRWSGMAGLRVYRNGQLMGTLNYTRQDEGSALTILDAADSPLAAWPVDSMDINWAYSGAVQLLNAVSKT